MIGFIAFGLTIAALSIPTAIMIGSDLAHSYGQWRRDRIRRRVSRMRFDCDSERWS